MVRGLCLTVSGSKIYRGGNIHQQPLRKMDRRVEERKQNLDQMSITWLLSHSILVLLQWSSWRHWWAKQTHSHSQGWELSAEAHRCQSHRATGLGYHGIWLWDFFFSSWSELLRERNKIKAGDSGTEEEHGAPLKLSFIFSWTEWDWRVWLERSLDHSFLVPESHCFRSHGSPCHVKTQQRKSR